MPKQTPAVLVLAGHDPTGGAGIQADIEAIKAQGAHALCVITALTRQDSKGVYQITPQDPAQVLAQIDTLLADIPIKAIKIGLIGSLELTQALHNWLQNYRQQHKTPIILDPVLSAGGTGKLGNQASHNALKQLLNCIDIITPNSLEARKLSDKTNLRDAADTLLKQIKTVLITGTHEQSESVINRCYRRQQSPLNWQWPRLAQNYHGSGCTLAAALAGQLAHGTDLETALTIAQSYTWQSLNNGYALGTGQWFPNR